MPGFKPIKIKQHGSTSRVFAGRSIGRVKRTVGTTGRRHSRGSSGSIRPRRRLFDGIDQAMLARVLTVIAFLAVVGVGVWMIVASANSGGSEIAMSLSEADTSRPITPDDPVLDGSSKVTVTLGGNIKLHGEVLDAAKASNNNFVNYLYEMGAVMQSDLSIVNLMGSLSSDGSTSAYPSAKYPTELAQALSSINVNAVVTANSQTMLQGYDSLAYTTQTLNEQGIDCLGTDMEGGKKWQVLDYNGIKIGVGAYHCATKDEIKELADKQKAAGATQEQIDSCISQLSINIDGKENNKSYSKASKAIVADVEAMRAEGAEVVMVLINWGSAGQSEPNDAMKTLAQRMIDAQVDITVGFGPDVTEKVTVKEVEKSDGTKKNCYVFYSLGNFFADVDKGATAKKYESIVVKFDISRPDEGSPAAISAGSVYPVYINRDATFITENTQRKYLVIPPGLYEYKSDGAVRPAVFTSDELWSKYSSTFTHVRTNVQSNWDVDKYLSLGSVSRAQDTTADTSGDQGTSNL